MTKPRKSPLNTKPAKASAVPSPKLGRPTDYNDAVQAKAAEYAEGGFRGEGDVVPSKAGLALALGVTRQTLTNWAAAHPVFLATLGKINHTQERVALNGGLKNELNSTIVKLLLANHGYTDKVEQAHTSPDGSMTPITKIERVIING